MIWSGGYYHLKRINLETKSVRLYPGVNSITTIQEKDSRQMWIGTRMGLYLLDKQSGVYRYIDLPVESLYICALYQREDGILYIGTRGAGLLVYDINKKNFIHQYRSDNCALISDNIYTILPRQDGSLLMGTENGITIYSPEEHFFRNWTREQGLMSVNFNAGSATTYNKSALVFGGNDGAVKFPTDIQIPEPHYSRLLLRDFMIAYHPVYPGDEGSPLEKDIDETDRLELAYGQNTFSLDVASINYDYPSNILFSWKIDGYHKEWSRPSQDNRIIIRNLPPGSYTLQIRAVSNEEKYKTYETRSIQIIITPPVWASVWAMVGYVILLVLVMGIIFRIIMLHKQKKVSDEKTRFFINTAHDIRTPLTLIKAPLEEVLENRMGAEQALPHINMALKNVNTLLQLTTNLINFERIDVYSSTLYVSEYELNTYMNDVCATFRKYAAQAENSAADQFFEAGEGELVAIEVHHPLAVVPQRSAEDADDEVAGGLFAHAVPVAVGQLQGHVLFQVVGIFAGHHDAVQFFAGVGHLHGFLLALHVEGQKGPQVQHLGPFHRRADDGVAGAVETEFSPHGVPLVVAFTVQFQVVSEDLFAQVQHAGGVVCKRHGQSSPLSFSSSSARVV